MTKLLYTDIGKKYTGTAEKKSMFENAIAALEWIPIAGNGAKKIPLSQGYALMAIIKEWKMQVVDKISFGGIIESKDTNGTRITLEILAVRAKVKGGVQDIYFVDEGTGACPVALTDVITE